MYHYPLWVILYNVSLSFVGNHCIMYHYPLWVTLYIDNDTDTYILGPNGIGSYGLPEWEYRDKMVFGIYFYIFLQLPIIERWRK